MGTYYDKKKLLEENNDLYISPYDKNLDFASLSEIIDSKKKYKAAEAKGDKSAMKIANDKANSIRQNAGYYDGGDDGSEYNRSYKSYEINRPASYKSKYSSDKDKVLSLISEANDFSYNLQSDPLYEIYKQIYLSLGDDAYERALSQNAMRTGGTVSSSAQSAAMQAKNKYNSMLSEKVPELYELAYEKHLDGLNELYKRLDALSSLDETEYERYRDEVGDFENDREYFYKTDRDYSDKMFDAYKYDTDLEYDISRDIINDNRKDNEFAYEKERDKVKDSQWQKEFEHDKAIDYNKIAVDKMDIVAAIAKLLTGKTPISRSTANELIALLGL